MDEDKEGVTLRWSNPEKNRSRCFVTTSRQIPIGNNLMLSPEPQLLFPSTVRSSLGDVGINECS